MQPLPSPRDALLCMYAPSSPLHAYVHKQEKPAELDIGLALHHLILEMAKSWPFVNPN